MAQIFDLGKLRFVLSGDYSATTQYELNDIVRYGGNVYVYTSPVATTGYLPTNTVYWQLMVAGLRYRGLYAPNTNYLIGDSVSDGTSTWLTTVDFTSPASGQAGAQPQLAFLARGANVQAIEAASSQAALTSSFLFLGA